MLEQGAPCSFGGQLDLHPASHLRCSESLAVERLCALLQERAPVVYPVPCAEPRVHPSRRQRPESVGPLDARLLKP